MTANSAATGGVASLDIVPVSDGVATSVAVIVCVPTVRKRHVHRRDAVDQGRVRRQHGLRVRAGEVDGAGVAGGDVAVDVAGDDRDRPGDADGAAAAGEREAGDRGRADVDERPAADRAADLGGAEEHATRPSSA